MASTSDKTLRTVIPDWKNLNTSAQSGELLGNSQVKTIIPQFPIAEYIEGWLEKQSLATAGDVISAAIMNGHQSSGEIVKAAKFVMAYSDNCPLSLYKSAERILTNSVAKTTYERRNNVSHKLDLLLDKDHIYKERIRLLRSLINKYPYNALWYTEIARCYINLGQVVQAKKMIEIALHLCPTSRYISRSASRLFLHIGDLDHAHRVLIDNPSIKQDPWLMASEIAINYSRGRTSRFMKDGIGMIKSCDYSPFSITELSSAIGTKELNHSRKKGIEYISKSLITPNDNSLAQADWLVHIDKTLGIDFTNIQKPLFRSESEARHLFNNDCYEDALSYAVDWIEATPFAHSSIFFASNIAYTYLNKYADAIKILKIGLKANPNEPAFMNNLAYAYALNGNTDDADMVLANLLPRVPRNTDTYICAIATKGLIEFRKGNLNEGRTFYMQAINFAKDNAIDKSLVQKAILNYIREEVKVSKRATPPELINLLDDIKTDDEKEIYIMKKNILAMLKES